MQVAALIKLDGSKLGMNRIRVEEWNVNEKTLYQNDDNGDYSQDDCPTKRVRSTYAVVIKNLHITEQILSEVECYFAKRIGSCRNNLHASRMKSRLKSRGNDYVLLEFPTKRGQQAALRLDGSIMGSHTIEVQEWRGGGFTQNCKNEPLATNKQESDSLQKESGPPPDIGEGHSSLKVNFPNHRSI